jgi:hypothetical protein
MVMCLLSFWKKWVSGIFLGDQVYKAGNFIAISEPTVWKVWDPQRLTDLHGLLQG